MNENELSYRIMGVALELHKSVGPGLPESVHENALAHDLMKQGLEVKTQVLMPFIYKDKRLEIGYRLDILVEDKLIIEVKSVKNPAPVPYSQVLTYLKLSGIKTEPLINFNKVEGIHRTVNNL